MNNLFQLTPSKYWKIVFSLALAFFIIPAVAHADPPPEGTIVAGESFPGGIILGQTTQAQMEEIYGEPARCRRGSTVDPLGCTYKVAGDSATSSVTIFFDEANIALSAIVTAAENHPFSNWQTDQGATINDLFHDFDGVAAKYPQAEVADNSGRQTITDDTNGITLVLVEGRYGGPTTGSISIRKPDGEPPTDSLAVWLRANTGITSDGNFRVVHWADQSGRDNGAHQDDPDMRPTWTARLDTYEEPYLRRQALSFVGDLLVVPNSPDINVGGPYTAKTIAVVFQTGEPPVAGVEDRQVLWEQGGGARGLNIYIDDGKLYVNGWNRAEEKWGPAFVTADVESDTAYYVVLVYDEASDKLEGFLNGQSMGSVGNIDRLYNHGNGIGIGGVNGSTRFHDGTGKEATLNGRIAEIVSYNKALSSEERQALEGYLVNKYFE